MCNTSKSALARLLFLPAMGLVTAALAVSPAWAQEEKKDEAKDTAKDTAKDAKDTAKDTAKDAKDTAKDTAKDAKDSAKDTAKDAKDSAKDTAKSTKDSAKDAAKQTTDRAKQGTKDSTYRAPGAAKDAAKTQRDTAKGTRDSARDTARDTRDAARDTARDTRDAARDARDSTRDTRTTRDSRDNRDLEERRDIDSRDARDVRDRRDTRDTRDIDRRDVDRRDLDRRDIGRRDVDIDRREVDIDRRDIDRRDIDINRRDIDRRDVRSDVRTRTDTRVSRAQIDNFRADSVTARDLGVTFGRATDRGLVIQDLSRTAVLADFGLRRNDVIVSVADHPVTSEREFFRWIFAEDLRHERITLIVLRDGREVPIYVRPVTIIEELVVVQDDFDPLQQFGVVIDDRRPREIVVTRVLPGTPAFRAGIRQGDIITTFRGQRLIGPQQFVQVLSTVEPGTVPFQVTRNRQVQELQVEVPRMARQTVIGPDLDVDAPGVERREERREIRIERREERRDGVPGVQPVQPARPVAPARPGILPRNR
jgi:hypothetical protein